MARPRKFYVIWENGQAVRVVEGRPNNYAGPRNFTDRLAAEEYAMWWNHEHPLWFESQRGPKMSTPPITNTQKRTATNTMSATPWNKAFH